MKPFRSQGTWWLPSSPQHRVAGTVSFTENDGVTLTLRGFLEADRREQPHMNFKKYPLILGETRDGQKMTLVDATERGLVIRYSRRRGGTDRIIATAAYLGAHFIEPQTVRFHKADICYSYLAQWAGVFPYRGHQEAFPEIEAQTTKGVITVQATKELGDVWINEADLPEAVWMRIEVQEAFSLSEWLSQIFSPLQSLLNLVTQRVNTFIRIQFYPDGILSVGENAENATVQAMFLPLVLSDFPSDAPMPPQILFSLQDVKNRLSDILEAWLNAAVELDSVFALLTRVQYMKLYLEQRFLYVAQAVETYQNRRHERYDLPLDQHQQRVEAILQGCPQEYRDWLEEQLQYSNVATFRRKVKDLVQEQTWDILRPLLKNSKLRGNFIELVYQTRNYYTHHDPEIVQKIARGDLLLMISDTLYIALQANILYEMGFSLEQCIEMFHLQELYGLLLEHAEYFQSILIQSP